MTHLYADCRDYVSGDAIADDLATMADVTCGHCRAVAGRTL